MDRARLLLVVFGLAGCWSPAAPAQRLTESAYEMNSATRWGRMDIAIDHVGDSAREAFGKQHARWGRSIRILDVEFSGMSLKNKGTEGEVVVAVTWQRLDEADVRTTSIAQRWVELRGRWSLLSEEEKGGDAGLLVEDAKAKASAKDATKESTMDRSRYQTREIDAPPE